MKTRSTLAGLAVGSAGLGVPHPTYVTNRAVAIWAPREDVWPWLAQMGEDPRGGSYSYEWIERLLGMRVHNADDVLPRFQRPRAGLMVDRAGNMEVKAVEPGYCLVLGPPDRLPGIAATWALELYEQPAGTTRLVSRVRAKLPEGPRGWLWLAVLDPGQFLMERRMLLEIRRRAEALAAARATSELASLSRPQSVA